MKKIFVTIALLLVVLTSFGCNTKHLTIEQSKANFVNYYSEIEKVANKYNVALEKVIDPMIGNQDSYMDLNIMVDDNESIYIRIVNSAYESEKGVESFSIEYTIDNGDGINDFNTDLFVELTNVVSGKTLYESECVDFLSAPEEKYKAEDYGMSKSEDMIIYKYYPLNFLEDWTMYYTLDKNNTEVLIFGGFTKQSMTD